MRTSATQSSQSNFTPTSEGKSNSQPFFSPKSESRRPFFGGNVIQSKLEIGQPGDKYEREADRVANQVMRMPDPNVRSYGSETLQMKSEPAIQAKCEACSDKEELQRKPQIQRKVDGSQTASSDVTQRINASKGSGQALPEKTRQEMGTKMGSDFSNVRVHTGSNAIQLNRELGARAFTVGNDIFFNRGEYNPHIGEGKRLMAHELVHTVQQGEGKNKVQRQASGGSRIPNLENRNNQGNATRSYNHASGVSGSYRGLPQGELNTTYERREISMSNPNRWCEELIKLVEYEQQNGRLNTILRYNPANHNLLSKLNFAIPSIYGLVDVDWMLRLSYTQVVTIFPSILSPSIAESIGMLSANMNYLAAKTFWNVLRSSGTYVMYLLDELDSELVIEFELDSLLYEHNLNAPKVVRKWINGDKSLSEIFAPALVVCDENLDELNEERSTADSHEIQIVDNYENNSRNNNTILEGVTFYTVKEGDTLSSIADDFGLQGGWQQIYELNRDFVSDPHTLFEGQIIMVPGAPIRDELVIY